MHPKSWILIAAQHKEVLSLCCSRLAPTRIIVAMRYDYGITESTRKIYKVQKAERRRFLTGCSLLATLPDDLKTFAYINAPYISTCDAQRRLTASSSSVPRRRKSAAHFSPLISGSKPPSTQQIVLACHYLTLWGSQLLLESSHSYSMTWQQKSKKIIAKHPL